MWANIQKVELLIHLEQNVNHDTMNTEYISHLSLHLVLATESAQVLAVLGNFHLLDSLPQTGTISGSVLSGDSDLLCSLGHDN